MYEAEKGRKIGQQKKKKKKERKKEKEEEKERKKEKKRKEEEEEEEEEGMVPSKDPLLKPGVELNHQPFDLESNALSLALPGLAHANCRTISTKEQPFYFYFYSVPFTSHVWVRGSWSRCWRRGT